MTDRTTERTSAEERAAWRESVGIGARISSNVMARAAERLLDDLDEARALLREWRDDAYPCIASTCKCESRFHMRVGPTRNRVERSDALLDTHKEGPR